MGDKNIYQRISSVQSELSYLKKDKKVSTGGNNSYTALTHDKVVGELRGLLVKYGIVTIPSIVNHNRERFVVTSEYNGKPVEKNNYFTELQIKIEFVNIEDPKDRFESGSIGYGIDNQDKGIGKAFSYAVKYALLKTFMIESGDDEEERQPDSHYEPIDYKAKDAILLAIKDNLGRLTSGMDIGTKGRFLIENLKVSSFDDLKRRSIEVLNANLDTLKNINKDVIASVKWDDKK
jgi:hypothetical protein